MYLRWSRPGRFYENTTRRIPFKTWEILSGVMRYFAKEYDPGREEFWAVVGILHDLDFEMYPRNIALKGRKS